MIDLPSDVRPLVLQGDCLEVLKGLPAKSVHCVITSPPYYQLREYGDEAAEHGREETPEEYVAKQVEVARAVRRVLRDDGTYFYNVGDKYDKNGCLFAMPARLQLAFIADGWILRCDIIWEKTRSKPESAQDRPTRNHEYIFMLSKPGQAYYYDLYGVSEPLSATSMARYKRTAAVGETFDPTRHKVDARGVAESPMDILTRSAANVVSKGYRNKRSVWAGPTTNFHGGHFAVFPDWLPEIIIHAATSEHGVCSKCGAQWERILERVSGFDANNNCRGCGEPRNRHIAHGKAEESPTGLYRNKNPDEEAVACAAYKCTGWKPGCTCNAPVTEAIVLDHYAGAGTTSLVAQRLNRRSIAIELDPENVKLIKDRVSGMVQPMHRMKHVKPPETGPSLEAAW